MQTLNVKFYEAGGLEARCNNCGLPVVSSFMYFYFGNNLKTVCDCGHPDEQEVKRVKFIQKLNRL